MTSLQFLFISILLFILINVYFKIADHFNIIDKPNERSSHTNITIRGGGILFALAYITYLFFSPEIPLAFTIGLIAITTVSFLDDILTLPNKVRLPIHFIAMALLFYQCQLFDQPIWFVFIYFVISVGIINAYNFMDGINGINGLYSMAVIGSFYYLNQTVHFIDSDLLIILFISLIVFGFYNFRKKAKCFAGDVGSVSIAFIIIYLTITAINKTNDYSIILFLLIYGIDSILTIINRLMKKENIFKAHRSHLYQYFSNELKQPHLLVASVYALLQVCISWLIIYNMTTPFVSPILLASVLITSLTVIYIATKIKILKKINQQ